MWKKMLTTAIGELKKYADPDCEGCGKHIGDIEKAVGKIAEEDIAEQQAVKELREAVGAGIAVIEELQKLFPEVDEYMKKLTERVCQKK